MMIWLLLLMIFLAALALMLVPLFRYRNNSAPLHDMAKNIAVYTAQLDELRADQNNGVLSPAEAAAAGLEIERRLLKASDEQDHGDDQNHHDKSGDRQASPALLMMIVTVTLLASAAFYLVIGLPGMPDFALKNQPHSVPQQAENNSDAPEMIRAVAEVTAHLQKAPDDAAAWRSLGQYQSALGRPAAAAQAFQQLYQRDRDNSEAALIYSESLIIMSEGRVSPAALLILNRLQETRPENPGVRHYLALADYQTGNVQQALTSWQSLERDSAADAPWRPALHRWIMRAQNDLGLPITEPVAPPLGVEERKAIAAMSPEEQTAMIRDMVARLAQKMTDNPDNSAGWLRLAKAYMILAQRAEAIEALKQAEKYASDEAKPQIKKQLEILLK